MPRATPNDRRLVVLLGRAVGGLAALTAIFAKIGIQGVDSDLATLVRTAIIIIVLALFVWFNGKWSNPRRYPHEPGFSWACRALATGASGVLPVLCSSAKPPRSPLSTSSAWFWSRSSRSPSRRTPVVAREWSGIAMVAAGVLVLAIKR